MNAADEKGKNENPIEPNGSVIHAESGTFREVVKMSAPLVVSYISFSLMGTVDTLIMGRVGTPEQGAVGLGAMVAWLLGTIFVGTVTVINTFVAQDFGAGRFERMRRHVNTGVTMIPLFVGMIWLIIPFLPKLIALLGTTPEVAGHTGTYISIRVIGAPFLLINFTLTSFLRGLGNMRSPMVITLVANLVNVPLTLVLVFGWLGMPTMGVAGAAAGSLMAGMFETLLYVLVYLGPKYNRLYQTRRWNFPTGTEIAKLLRVGLPIGLSWLFDMLVWTLFSIYASTLAPASLAAHMIVLQIMHYSFLPAAAVSIVATTLVGQYLGGNRVDLAHRSAIWTLVVGIGYMAFVGLVMILLRNPLISLFNADFAVIAVGVKIIIIAGLFQPFDGVWLVVGGALRGAGDTRFPMIAMIFVGGLVFIPGVYLLGEHFGLGIVGAWMAALIHTLVFAIVIGTRFRLGKWKTMRAE